MLFRVSPAEESLQLDRVATLCRLERVQRQEVGARVEVVAEARLQLVDVTRVSPYIKGVFKQVPHLAPRQESRSKKSSQCLWCPSAPMRCTRRGCGVGKG